MPLGIWHALDVAADFSPIIPLSSGLNFFALETILLSTVIGSAVVEKKLELVD